MRIALFNKVLLSSAVALLISTAPAYAASTNKKATITKKTSTPPAVVTVSVNPGDNLSEIATNNGTTMLRLFYANTQISDPNLIFPGEVLTIPTPDQVLTVRSLPADTTPVPSATPNASVTSDIAASAVTSTSNASIWDELANCESGGNWAIDTGNGFYGGLQFTLSSWQRVGGSGYPNQASQSEQIARASILQSQQGWGAWPTCSAKLGL